MDSMVVTTSGPVEPTNLSPDLLEIARSLIVTEYDKATFEEENLQWWFRLYRIYFQRDFLNDQDIIFSIFSDFILKINLKSTEKQIIEKDQIKKQNDLVVSDKEIKEKNPIDKKIKKMGKNIKQSKQSKLNQDWKGKTILDHLDQLLSQKASDIQLEREFKEISEKLLTEELMQSPISNLINKQITFGRPLKKGISGFSESSK